MLKAYGTSGARHTKIAADRRDLTSTLGVAVDLLCLSRPVALLDVRELMPEVLVEHLISAGLAATDGDRIALPRLRVLDHHGQLLFSGRPDSPIRNGYYGVDSAGIGRLLLGARGRLPWTANGGTDGCRLPEAALDRIRLSDRGKLFSTAMMPGNRVGGPDVDWLRSLASRKSWSVTVIPTGDHPIGPDMMQGRYHAEMISLQSASLVAEVIDALAHVRRSTDIDTLINCLLTAVPSATAGVTIAFLSLRLLGGCCEY